MSSVYFNDRVWQDEFLETVLDFTETVHVQSSRVHRKMFWAALAAIPLAIVKGELRQSWAAVSGLFHLVAMYLCALLFTKPKLPAKVIITDP
jgi:hypothetical protein